MIYLYSGTPGSGKSLHTARVIYYHLAMGKPVICNFDINKDKVKNSHLFVYLDNSDLDPSYLINYYIEYCSKKHKVKEGEILLVIDECQLLFNARDWSKQGRSDWNSFFTQHRKYKYDIILVAQFDRMIDRQIRSLIEYEQVHRKVSNFGWRGKLLSLMLGATNLFCSVKVWYPMKEKVSSELFRANKKYYSLYNTYNTFKAD